MKNPLETTQTVPAGNPFDIIAGAFTGDYGSLQDYAGVVVKIIKGPGTAGQDPTFTIYQAQDNSGTGAKALNITEYWTKQAATDLSSTGQRTKVTQSASNSITNSTLGEQAALIEVWIDAEDFDVDNGFTHIRVDCDDPGNSASQFAAILYEFVGARYGGEPSEALSAL